MKTLIILGLTAIIMAESDVERTLQAGNDQFTAKMFQEVAKSKPKESVVLSAFSVLSPLAQLGLASVGESHDEILQAIGMPNDNVTKEVFTDVKARFGSAKGVELKQANKVYVRVNYSLNDEFVGISKDVFDSELQNIDFRNEQAAVDEINKWVEDHTNNRIKNLLTPSVITPDTAAVLVNAIYFKGNWKFPFAKERTQELTFFPNKEDKVTRPMMHQTESLKYAENPKLNAKFLEMPYEGDETSFVVVLPNIYDGIDSLIEKLKDPETFPNCRKTMFTVEVDVTLPKFKIETTTDLKKVLPKLNINKLFSEKTARLNNLIKGEENLYVSDAVQKAFIEVNEEGAEAAAANFFGIAFGTSVGAPRLTYNFNADHPFVFYLMKGDTILFNGVYRS